MNLKTLRELKGISRKELADMTGISFRSIQDYEQGHKELSSAKADTILKMAGALGCTMEDLISDFDLSSLKPSELKEMVSGENQKSRVLSAQGEGSYILMHKDREVAGLVLESETGSIVSVTRVMDETRMPIGTVGEDRFLKAWWYHRAVPVTQGDLALTLEKLGFLSPQAYLLRNLGLSLNDDYWLKPQGSSLTWNDVNLYANEFDDVVGASHFAGFPVDEDFAIKKELFPSGSTKGNVPKSWVCVEGKRYLVKGTEGNKTQQIFNEVVGAYIHRKQQKFDFVDYEFYTIDYGHGKRLGVSAEAFTSEDLEFVSARELIRAGRRMHKGASDYDIFVNACEDGGIPKSDVEAFLDYQILTDFIITNTDRNYDNFGVLRDAETLKFVKLAPIFDSGNSMFYDLDMNHGTLELNNIPVDSFAENEFGLLRLVKDPSIVDMDKLLTNDELSKVLASSNRTPEQVRVLLSIYDKKKEMLFKLKRGELSWLNK